MNEPALTEAVKTALPSPKPNRRRRLALRFAVLVVAVSVLGAAYSLTRPPELVWWRSPEIRKSGKHVYVLVPWGWEWDKPTDYGGRSEYGWVANWATRLVDRRPRFVRFLTGNGYEDGSLRIRVGLWNADITRQSDPELADFRGQFGAGC